MFNIFKNKTIEEVKAKARAEGFAQAELVMQDALDKSRTSARKRENELVNEHTKEMSTLRKEIEKNLGFRIAELTNANNLLKEQIHRDRKAWQKYKDFVPEALRIVHLLKADAYSRVEEAGSRYNHMGQYENSLENIARQIEKMTPKMNELMHGDVEMERLLGNGDGSEFTKGEQ